MNHKVKLDKSLKRKYLLKPTIISLTIIAVLLIFLLFPRKSGFKDGGTVVYESFGFGVIYRVEDRHRIANEGGYGYYEVGKVITVFGFEIYNNAHIDYETKSQLNHSPEDIENQRIIDEYFDSLERDSQTSDE